MSIADLPADRQRDRRSSAWRLSALARFTGEAAGFWPAFLEAVGAAVGARRVLLMVLAGDRPWYAHAQWPAAAEQASSDVPQALDLAAIDQVVDDFCAAASRADRAGFDVVELHYGHGYLVTSFLSPLSNQRTDAYGGDRDGRMKLALRVAAAVRQVWPAHKPLFCRISAVDGGEGGWSLDDSVVLARALHDVGVDVIDCSSGGLTEQTRALPVPRGLGLQAPFSLSLITISEPTRLRRTS